MDTLAARSLMGAVAMRRTIAALTLLALQALHAAPVRADPWFGSGDNAVEDSFADGDIDKEDTIAMRIGSHTGAADLRGESWVSLMGFRRELMSGKNDTGGVLLVGLALDRIAAGPVHRIADEAASTPAKTPAQRDAALLAVPELARKCVTAALRTSGLGVDDARVDDIVSRSRASAWLPETRLRAMRLWDDAAHATTLATTNDTTYYDALGANLVLELRLTWRLDRLLFAGDEPTLERVRLERQDARARVATRTLEVLFTWERAEVDAQGAVAGSREEVEARLRRAEAEATLDVLTGGWFSERDPPSLTQPDPAVR